MDEVLQLLRQLYILCTKDNDAGGGSDLTSASESAASSSSSPEMFMSKKITNKLVQQIQDPLVLSADALPDWCKELSFTCPMLFPFETRLLHFHCTAFGASRWVNLEFCAFCHPSQCGSNNRKKISRAQRERLSSELRNEPPLDTS